jgi:hypothetical protein
MKNAGKFPVIMRITQFMGILGLLLLSGFGGAGCRSGPEELPDYERRSPESARSDVRRVSADRPQLVGKVSLINTEDEFVLIELQTPRVPEPGMMLVARNGQMKTAQLKVSQEERRPFIIADIQEGLPHQEDRVFLEAAAALAAQSTPARRSSGGSTPVYDGEADLPDDWDEPIPELELLSAEEARGEPQDDEIRVIVNPDSETPLFETGGL